LRARRREHAIVVQQAKASVMKKTNSILVVILVLFLGGFFSTASAENKGGLFVNLTTDDTWAAAKAILFAHEKVLKQGHKPVAIWLNVRAI
jgi:hypothetical protein